MRDRVIKSFESNYHGTFRRDKPIGLLTKRQTATTLTECFERRESDVNKKVVCGCDTTSQHEIRLSAMKFIASQLDSVERRRTSGV